MLWRLDRSDCKGRKSSLSNYLTLDGSCTRKAETDVGLMFGHCLERQLGGSRR